MAPRERSFFALQTGRDVGEGFPACKTLMVIMFKTFGTRYSQRFVGALNIFNFKFLQQIKQQYISEFTLILA
jgi:hypothetical protein